MKKLKIFLGGYVNFMNAQNINCANIAKYLDKEKFEVHTMYTTMMPIDKKFYEERNIHLHKLIHHRFIWYWTKYFTMKFGKYDIYYLPKRETMDVVFAKRNKKRKDRVFISSIEGVVTDTTNNTDEMKDYFLNYMDNTFAISNCIAQSVKKYYNAIMPVLHLGVVEQDVPKIDRTKVKNIIWAGNIKDNKRPQLLTECAEKFPQLSFTMIGDGDLLEDIKQECKVKGINNITFTGRIPNEEVYNHMQKSDLFLMTSEFEGLPKVIQEAAQCSLPTIYIDENYTVDFIENGENGIAVKTVDEMIEKIQYLIDNPDVYGNMASKAYDVVQNYLWKNLIKDYEAYFTDQYEKKNNSKD